MSYTSGEDSSKLLKRLVNQNLGLVISVTNASLMQPSQTSFLMCKYARNNHTRDAFAQVWAAGYAHLPLVLTNYCVHSHCSQQCSHDTLYTTTGFTLNVCVATQVDQHGEHLHT